MLWYAISLPHLPIEWRPPELGVLAVVERSGQRRIVRAGNDAARSCGVQMGMDATVALARAPNLQLLERSPKDEARALTALAGWAYQFSSVVSMDAARGMLWIEVGASQRYFDGLAKLLPRIRDGVVELGYTTCCAAAPTPEAAALLTRGKSNVCVIRRGALRSILGARPLHELYIEPAVLDHLHTVGLRSIDELLAIPPASLARRFGRTLNDYLQRLFGHLPDPRPHYRLPPRYRRRFDCTYPIGTVEALLFPLRRLLQELQGELRGRDAALQELDISLRHRDSPQTELKVRTTRVQRDAVRLFGLVRETLERTTLPEPVVEILLAVDHFIAPDILQTDLFDEKSQLDTGWTAVLDKLRARLGNDAVRSLGLSDDHRPEKAWCVRTSAQETELPDDMPERPLWILEPQALEHLPQLLGTPERIEAGWWQSDDSSRDYYVARSSEGALWWLYRDLITKRWFLHGLWG